LITSPGNQSIKNILTITCLAIGLADTRADNQPGCNKVDVYQKAISNDRIPE